MSKIDIDWSKAPEGTTGAMIASFFEEESGIHPGFVEFIGFDGADDRDVYEEGEDAWIFVAKPSPWTGEGLPPVGTVCEYMNGSGHWHEVRITGHAELGVCFRCPGRDGENYVRIDSEFRPIRTPEQIAAEERDDKIQEMLYFWKDSAGPGSFCAALYDAGYRKVEL